MGISSSPTEGVRTLLQMKSSCFQTTWSEAILLCSILTRQVAGKPRIRVERVRTPLVSHTREKYRVLLQGLYIRWSRLPHLLLLPHSPAHSVKNPDMINRFQQRYRDSNDQTKGRRASNVKWGHSNPNGGIKFGREETNAVWGHKPCA